MSENRNDELKRILQQFSFDIKDEKYEENYYRLKIDNCFLFFDEINDEIHLTFNAKARPDYSANIISLISNNLNIQKIYVTELYYDNENGTYFGDISYNEYMKDLYKNMAEDYQKDMDDFYFLENVELNTIN